MNTYFNNSLQLTYNDKCIKDVPPFFFLCSAATNKSWNMSIMSSAWLALFTLQRLPMAEAAGWLGGVGVGTMEAGQWEGRWSREVGRGAERAAVQYKQYEARTQWHTVIINSQGNMRSMATTMEMKSTKIVARNGNQSNRYGKL